MSIDSKVLVILEEGNEFAALSARNLPNVKVATATTASVLDIANSDKLLVTQAAISKIEGGSCIMNLYDVIKNLLSLKSQWLNLKQANMYSKLTLALIKLLIKQAVEAAFEGVKVANVNTVNVKPKQNALDVTLVLLQN